MNVTITLVQDEIHAAIKDFIGKHNIITDDKDCKIDLVASRGAAGFSAVIALNGDLLAEVESRLTPPPVQMQDLPSDKPEVPVDPPTPAPDAKAIDELFGEEVAPPAEKKTRTRKATPAAEVPPVDDLPAGPTPPVAAAVDKEVDDLFAAENTLVEEIVPDVGSEDESLFN